MFVFDYRLNYLAAGLTPCWYHATNVALHAAACMLVTKVSLAVASLRPGFAALTGLLFATHPIHTDAVSTNKINPFLFSVSYACVLWTINRKQ